MDTTRSDPRVVHLMPQPTRDPPIERSPGPQLPVPLPPIIPPNSWVDQPTTQAGNIRTRVFVACQNCRTRKIKCDGLKPVCTNCIKKEYAPGPDFQHLLPANERYKLQNGVCLYDPVPKRRGPDRLPGARVRRKSRPDDSGYERGARQRVPLDSSEAYHGYPPQDHRVSASMAAGRPSSENARLDPRVGSLHPNSNVNQTFSRAPDAPRLYGASLSLETAQAASSTTSTYHDASRNHLLRDTSRVSPPESVSSSDSARSPVGLPASRQDRATGAITTNETSIPVRYRPNEPPSEPFVPQVSRTARGRQENSSYARTVAPHDNQAGSSHPANNPYYEYVPSAGAYIHPLEESESEELSRESPEGGLSMPHAPNAIYVQKTWFDSLLDIYWAFTASSIDSQRHPQNSVASFNWEERHRTQEAIVTDLRLLFSRSSHWFSFIHVPTFWARFHSPEARASSDLQPGLVLAALALGSFLRSSEVEGGTWGRERAARLRAEAEAAVESSLAVGWVDIGLAQATWFLAMYEICPHPYHTLQKVHSALSRLDGVIRLLGCNWVDAGNPTLTRFDQTANPLPVAARQPINAPKDSPFQLPLNEYSSLMEPNLQMLDRPKGATYRSMQGSSIYGTGSLDDMMSQPRSQPYVFHESKGCICSELTLGRSSPEWKKYVPLWQYTPKWPSQNMMSEIQREESRRITWASIQIMAAFSAHVASLSADRQLDEYWAASAENLMLLLPGESAQQLQEIHSFSQQMHQPCDLKNTVWAIYARAQLLYLACLRIRHSRNLTTRNSANDLHEGDLYLYRDPVMQKLQYGVVSDHELAAFAKRAWLQTQEMEEALNKHTCELERAFLFQGREYLSSTRMVITQDFRRYVPFPNSGTTSQFNRLQADEWLQHQSAVVQRLNSGLKAVTGMKESLLGHRPFFVWWFMIQIVRLLNLWSYDKSMTESIQLTFPFLPVVDYLTAIWPCYNQRNKYLALRERLDDACRQCGLPPPPPPDFNIDGNSRGVHLIHVGLSVSQST